MTISFCDPKVEGRKAVENVKIKFTALPGIPFGNYHVEAVATPPKPKLEGVMVVTIFAIQGGDVNTLAREAKMTRIPNTTDTWSYNLAGASPDNPNGAYWALVKVTWMVPTDEESQSEPVPYP